VCARAGAGGAQQLFVGDAAVCARAAAGGAQLLPAAVADAAVEAVAGVAALLEAEAGEAPLKPLAPRLLAALAEGGGDARLPQLVFNGVASLLCAPPGRAGGAARAPHGRALLVEALHGAGCVLPWAPRGGCGALLAAAPPPLAAALAPALLEAFVAARALGAVEAERPRARVVELLRCLAASPPHAAALGAAAAGGAAAPLLRFAHAFVEQLGGALEGVFSYLAQLKEGGARATGSAGEAAALAAALDDAAAEHVAAPLRLLTGSAALLAALCEGGGPPAALLAGPLCRDRLACALAAAVATLAGPRGVELRVTERLRARLHWAPAQLLHALLAAAVALAAGGGGGGGGGGAAEGGAWAAALAAQPLFAGGGGGGGGGAWARVEALAARLALPCAGAPLRALGAAVEAARAEEEALDALAHRAPEEFLDPLLHTLLRDPVRAGGGAGARVYDRASITQHILSDARDPFTKLPLREEMLLPLPELRERVERWVRDARAEGAAPAAGRRG